MNTGSQKARLFVFLFLFSLLYTFPVYNKYWAPYDEGIITVAAQRVLAGEIPYKDFFILMYPPGQIYVLALLYKIFSLSLTAGRIYTVFVGVGISLVVFYMTYILTRRLSVSLFSWFVALISLVGRLGAIPAPIWPGVFLSLSALFIFMHYLHNLKYRYLVFTGLFTALAVLFRHDIGIFAFAAIVIVLFVKILFNKNSYLEVALFAISAIILLVPVIFYFVTKSATADMVRSLLLFPFTHHKMAAIPFPKPCFNPRMIFHGSLHFIKINQYYIPILIYLFMGAYLIKALFKQTLERKENLGLLSILLFGILTFNQVRIRTDPAHLLTVIPPAVVLFGFMLNMYFLTPNAVSSQLHWQKSTILFRNIFIIFILFLFVLLTIKNIDKYIKNSFRKVYKKVIIETKFQKDRSIYIPQEERGALLNTIEFINKHTSSFERIFIGNIAHWKDDFGGSLVLYFLVNRIPSTKYYEIVPGLITDPEVQNEIKNSLIRHNVRVVVLQDIALDEGFQVGTKVSILDDYIKNNYKQVKKFGKFNIFTKK